MHFVSGADPGRKVFTLLVEMRCNSYCLFCGQREVDEALIRTRRRLALAVPRNEHAGVHARYTLESATESLSRARREGFTEVSFQGGEPTLWPELPVLVGRAREMGFEFVGVVTNGRRLADRALAEALLGAGLHGITISLLGPDAATHDELSAAPGAFEALSRGMHNVAEVARARGSTVLVTANLIVTSKNVHLLDRCIEVLATHGIRSATLHLVRFDHMGSDPLVREMLRLDANALRDALPRALAAGVAHDVRVQSADLPECMHESLDPDRLARRAAATDPTALHRFEAADFGYDAAPSATHADTCARCMLRARCARLPEGHEIGPASFRPLDETSLGAALDAHLVAMDPRTGDAIDRLVAERSSYAWLERLAGTEGALEALRARVADALADIMAVAFRERDPEQLVRAAGALIGFSRRPRTFVADQAIWASSQQSFRRFERETAPIEPADAVLAIGDFDVALAGRWDGERYLVSSVRGIRPTSNRRDRLQFFAVTLLTSLFQNARLSVEPESFRVDRTDRPSHIWASEPNVVRWRRR